jgi:hypothetical protein
MHYQRYRALARARAPARGSLLVIADREHDVDVASAIDREQFVKICCN